LIEVNMASQFALFTSGLFFGGAIDHAILAAQGREQTPYGVRVGVSGNWLMAAGDLLVAAMLYRLHTGRLRRRGNRPNRRTVATDSRR
jgi:hypothetical protein